MTGVPASAAGGSPGARRAAASPAGRPRPGGTPGGEASWARTPASASATGSTADSVPGGVPGGVPVTGSTSNSGSHDVPGGEGHDGVGRDGDGHPARGRKITAAAVSQASVWNIANLLTMFRLGLVPGFVVLMLADGGYDPAWRSFAWAAFAVAMITDLFDGHLARTYNLVTDFGKIADPIADKAIMGAALICLSVLGDLPWWVTGVILGRELGITLLRLLVIRYGVIPASRGGKLKTLTQGVAVGMYVLALTGWLATLRFWVMAAAVVLTVVTGLDYVRQAIVLRRQGIAERKAALEETRA
ncbi:CDP-diacylglycerol--glycerol-3-phosphate 3-phosphatidyltransferase [Streptomyces sp. KMM 9044]|uniref:CDP-diacylglycerol--glycerol-3-phosphate 3-phosphatidyltransferase n=1 Tax=Streptomyces sp. KMM 9044 TaxID=2744474 RepID=UPI002151F66F|nr:CDP-diacylglycerol--glycerol-3-phosphate 3-phosphatidyltransferase [Streptomyces sp. KMM 9044]WAX77628.1 CDP-diacylglycerol--glycerol-3-phosphate 3-phosphatidyltransferase [Streptomyces sp. KMM 9044]